MEQLTPLTTRVTRWCLLRVAIVLHRRIVGVGKVQRGGHGDCDVDCRNEGGREYEGKARRVSVPAVGIRHPPAIRIKRPFSPKEKKCIFCKYNKEKQK